MRLLSGLAKLFPTTPTAKEIAKNQNERYGEHEGTGDRELGEVT